MLLFATLAAVAACIGVAQAIGGLAAVRRFSTAARAGRGAPEATPPVTIFKPLHGDEPLLEEALASFCAQDYPDYQIVFGLHRADDPALAVVDRLRARFPSHDITVVIDGAAHGTNGKIGNLINMYPHARHDIMVIADSDTHAAPDYLRHLVAALAEPGVGLVTTLYSALPAERRLAGLLGAAQISHVFLPGTLLARALGRQDCLGATMALRRETLEAIGGFHALADHIADDALLGKLVVRHGARIGLALTIPATTVPEGELAALLRHELRWNRTIHAVSPLGFLFSSFQYPVFWALLAFAGSALSAWAAALLGVACLTRIFVARGIDGALGLGKTAPYLLLPVRDLLSVGVMIATYRGPNVTWRGKAMKVTRLAFDQQRVHGDVVQELAEQRLLPEG